MIDDQVCIEKPALNLPLGFCVQMEQPGIDGSTDVDDDDYDADLDDTLPDCPGMLLYLLEPPPLDADSVAATASSSSSSDRQQQQQLAGIRCKADQFARGMMSSDAAAAVPGVELSSQLSVATLAGMRAVAELIAVELFLADGHDPDAGARTLTRIRRHVQHILSLPAQP